MDIDIHVYLIIYLEKISLTLLLGRLLKYITMLNDAFAILHSEPNPVFQLCSMFLWFFCLFRLRYQVPGRHSMPYRHKEEKHSMQRPLQNGIFLSKIQVNINQHVLKWTSGYIIIVLPHLFNGLFVYAWTDAHSGRTCESGMHESILHPRINTSSRCRCPTYLSCLWEPLAQAA